MNARDKELAVQGAALHGHTLKFTPEILAVLGSFADLIRADERLALDAKDWTAIMREGALVTWGDAEELGERVRAVIEARGNT